MDLMREELERNDRLMRRAKDFVEKTKGRDAADLLPETRSLLEQYENDIKLGRSGANMFDDIDEVKEQFAKSIRYLTVISQLQNYPAVTNYENVVSLILSKVELPLQDVMERKPRSLKVFSDEMQPWVKDIIEDTIDKIAPILLESGMRFSDVARKSVIKTLQKNIESI